jgi:hypothetical protein
MIHGHIVPGVVLGLLWGFAFATNFPSAVDNSATPYFFRGYDQGESGACASVSRITMSLGYERNAYYRVPADSSNLLPAYFTWQVVASGHASEALLAQKVGVPDAATYGGILYSNTYGKSSSNVAEDYGWMQGYSRWYAAMHNRIDSVTFVSLATSEGRDSLKGWLYNHWDDTTFAAGGVAAASFDIDSWTLDTIKVKDEPWIVATSLPGATNHSVTIVGYDDSICLGENCGVWIVQNSWGLSFGNEGRFLVPYSVYAESHSPVVEVLHLRKDYTPKRTIKVRMSYGNRSKIKLSIGVSQDTSAKAPSKTEYLYHFRNDGFKGPMLGTWKDGVHTEEMEFGYDLTDISSGYDLRKPLKYFFTIQRDDYEDEGTLSFLSIKDYVHDSLVQELVVNDDTVKLSDQGRYEWAFVMPGNPDAAVDYVLSGSYTFEDLPSTDAKSSIQNLRDGNPSTVWKSTNVNSFPTDFLVSTETETFGLMYQGDEMSDGFLHNFTISGTTDGEEFQELATGAFKEDEAPQYVFWKQGKYTLLKIEIDDLWPSSDNSIHIAELMLVVPPDSTPFETITMDGLVAGGLPDADYPLLPLNTDSTGAGKSSFTNFGDKRRGNTRQSTAKVFIRNHEVLIYKDDKIFRINGVQ